MSEQWESWPTRTRVRTVAIAVVVIIMFVVLILVWSAIVPFLFGLVLAVLLLPPVNWLQRHLPFLAPESRVARLIALLLIYLAGLGVIVGILAYVIPTIINETQALFSGRGLAGQIQTAINALRRLFERVFPPSIQPLIINQGRAIAAELLGAAQGAIIGFLASVSNALVVILGYLVVPIWVFYVLYYADQLEEATMKLFPPTFREDILNVGHITADVLGSYIAGQLLLATIVGILSGLSLALLGVDFAALLGFITAVGDLIPTLGPILALIPALIIAGLERPILALWALLALLAVQQLENNFLGPYIIGDRVRLNPAIIIILLVIGGALWGLLGLLVIVPLFATLRDIYRYILIRTGREETPPSEALRRIDEIQKGRAI